MPETKQQVDINQLNQAKANVTLTQNLLNQAIEKCSSDPILALEAVKQAANEIAQAQTAVSQVQSVMQTQQSQ
ncbi:hypothetical protein P8864_19645 [Priestia flexa]|uniref:hypothetical protein n=1 Tax=Priestia flexa TaxID=86664 RepID=UPI000C237070|nr:hypothetical protein [Priestia flexa]MEC0668072.1 hypothetical protein [Priestia flexa]